MKYPEGADLERNYFAPGITPLLQPIQRPTIFIDAYTQDLPASNIKRVPNTRLKHFPHFGFHNTQVLFA